MDNKWLTFETKDSEVILKNVKRMLKEKLKFLRVQQSSTSLHLEYVKVLHP